MAGSRATVLIDTTPLSTPSGMRGIGRYVYELLQGLASLHESYAEQLRLVALLGIDARGEPSFSEDLREAAEVGMAARGTLVRETMRRRRQLWLGRACRAAGADLLHETEALGTPLRCATPRLTTCYDLIPLRYPSHYLPTPLHFGWQWLKDWRRYSGATRVVAISRRTRSDAIQLLRMDPQQIEVVPTGINLKGACSDSQADSALRELGIGAKPYLLYVGYGDFRKNVDNMLRALALARRELDVELVWAGALSPKLRAKVLAKAKRAGVTEQLRLLGFVPDDTLAALFHRALAHIFLSRLEGFGLSVAEAMAAGCPVIVARGSGSDEVAEGAGTLVDPDAPEQAAQAVLALARDPELRERQVSAGRTRAAAFSRTEMASGYLREYTRALESSDEQR